MGPTSKKDKLNDNLLFSCCCARVNPTWSTVCDCYEGAGRCDQGCLERSLEEESLFYSVGIVSGTRGFVVCWGVLNAGAESV